MKNAILIFLVMFSMVAVAQNNDAPQMNKREIRQKFTPEQRAELRSKKMALHLDLTEAQQKQVRQLLLEMERNNRAKAGKPVNSEEAYNKKMEILDRQVELKRELQKILSEEQYAKWENSHNQRRIYKGHDRKSHRFNKG